jgi:hypothetical protein
LFVVLFVVQLMAPPTAAASPDSCVAAGVAGRKTDLYTWSLL